MIHLVIGGSGSGKSEYAENLLAADQRKYYIATMQVYDEESRKKVARHQRLRQGKGFLTIEQPTNVQRVAELVAKEGKQPENVALLECLSNLVANEMFADEQEKREDFLVEKIAKDIQLLAETLDKLVIVSNNVFEDGISYDAQTMSYIRVLGRVNQKLAQMADHVTEVVVGIPVKVK